MSIENTSLQISATVELKKAEPTGNISRDSQAFNDSKKSGKLDAVKTNIESVANALTTPLNEEWIRKNSQGAGRDYGISLPVYSPGPIDPLIEIQAQELSTRL